MIHFTQRGKDKESHSETFPVQRDWECQLIRVASRLEADGYAQEMRTVVRLPGFTGRQEMKSGSKRSDNSLSSPPQQEVHRKRAA